MWGIYPTTYLTGKERFPGIKWPEHEANNLAPSNAEVNA
jgi:hypothetical protein